MGRSQLALFRNVTSGTSCHSKGNTQQPDLSEGQASSSCKYSNTYYILEQWVQQWGKYIPEFLVHPGDKATSPGPETNVL